TTETPADVKTWGDHAGTFAPDVVFVAGLAPHIAWLSEIAPTTSSDGSFKPMSTASDTIEWSPPCDGRNTRKKIARFAFRMSENRRAMSGGGGAEVRDGGG